MRALMDERHKRILSRTRLNGIFIKDKLHCLQASVSLVMKYHHLPHHNTDMENVFHIIAAPVPHGFA